MSSAAPTINISVAEQAQLAELWRVAFSWAGAANGFNPAYRHPIAMLMARDLAGWRLDEYFAEIEKLVTR